MTAPRGARSRRSWRQRAGKLASVQCSVWGRRTFSSLIARMWLRSVLLPISVTYGIVPPANVRRTNRYLRADEKTMPAARNKAGGERQQC